MWLVASLILSLVGCVCWCRVECLSVGNSPLRILVHDVLLRSWFLLHTPFCLRWASSCSCLATAGFERAPVIGSCLLPFVLQWRISL